MTSLAARERTLLSAAAQQVGADARTLCGDWTVRDLVVHLVLREGSPAAAGITLKPFEGWLEKESARLARQDFDHLVNRFRHGPPLWSPFRLPKVDALANLLEFLVHHEDIRRAQPDWQPRELTAADQDLVWRAVRHAGRGLVRHAEVGVALERPDTGDRVVLSRGDSEVAVRGLPVEVTLFVFGRTSVADVELLGSPADIDALTATPLGF